MLQEICSNVFNNKWEELSQIDFPVTAQKVAAFSGFDDFLRQFFFAEIDYYCKKILSAISENANLNPEILASNDAEQIQQILFDWIWFDEDNLKKILLFAIQTEINYLFNPANTLIAFNFSDIQECEIESCEIENIIAKFNFISDTQGIINELKNELLELQNQKKSISKKEFSDLINDVVFKVSQGQTIEEFLIPLNSFIQVSGLEAVPLNIISLFFAQRDLNGILSEIENFASKNEKDNFTYDEIHNLIHSLLNSIEEDSFGEDDTVDTVEEISNDDEITLDENSFNENETVEENSDCHTAFDAVSPNIDDVSIEMPCQARQDSEETVEEIDTVEENADCVFTVEAEKTDAEIKNTIETMRAENKNPYEITKEYLRIENCNVVNFKQKMECLP